MSLRCRHFGPCGGCTRLDAAIADELAAKAAAVARVLEPVAAVPVEVEVELPPRPPRHDRVKLLYPAQPDAAGELRLGLYERHSHRLVVITECQIQARALTVLARRAQECLRRHRLAPYDEAAERGFVRAFHARIAPGTGQLLIGLVTGGGPFAAAAAVAGELFEAASGLPPLGRRPVVPVGVVRSIHERAGNVLLGQRHLPLRGRDYLEDRAAGLDLRIGFASFYQSHRHADTILYRPALALLGDVSGLTVVDGYGGVGCFGLRLARAGAGRVVVVEEHPGAAADARHNAHRNRLAQVEVVQSPFAAAAPMPAADVLVVDPPRSGLGEAGCRRALSVEAARLLYVACSPPALARDLRRLGGAYRIARVRLVDLFPYTEHAEVLALLERR